MNNYQVGDRVMDTLGGKMRSAGLNGRAFLVSDENVHDSHGNVAMESLVQAGFRPESLTLPAGEPTKSFEVAQKIYEWLADQRAERSDNIVALGGGVVGDVAGFAAATYLRGMALVQVPTTLLAMVDSAIGGKVAVNLPRGKNLVGAFHQPRLIFADANTLRSLPGREISSGWAEAIKCAMIFDQDLLQILRQESLGLLALSSDSLVEVIERCARHKISVVEQDEREAGLRMVLNYGHTIGHALEAALGYGALLHGEAVAIGMTGAADIAVRTNALAEHVVKLQRDTLAAFRLPTHLPRELCGRTSVDKVMASIAFDKKVRDKAVRWILLDDIGRTRIDAGVPQELVRQVVSDLVSPPVDSAG